MQVSKDKKVDDNAQKKEEEDLPALKIAWIYQHND